MVTSREVVQVEQEVLTLVLTPQEKVWLKELMGAWEEGDVYDPDYARGSEEFFAELIRELKQERTSSKKDKN